VIPEVEMNPLGGKIHQPAGDIVSAFEDLLMGQYHCGAMAAASVGRSVVVVVITSRSPICGGSPHIMFSPYEG
jgi:hypothetical protein